MSGEDDRPPNRGRFRKGQSGNPGGRPRHVRSTSNSAFDVILDRTLKASRDGVLHEVTLEEALQQRTYQEALTGKRLAIREVLRWILKREQWIAKNEPSGPRKVTWAGTIQDPDNADQALLLLGIAREAPTDASA